MLFIGQLTWGTTWRMILWGLALGAVLGAVYGLLINGTLGFEFGFIIGAIAGACLGIADGLTMSVLTLIAFRSPKDRERYRLAMAFMAAGITIAVVALYGLQAAMFDLQRLLSNDLLGLLIVAPGIIAALASGCVARQVALWTWSRLVQRSDSVEYQGR
jgi:hypothetical protein